MFDRAAYHRFIAAKGAAAQDAGFAAKALPDRLFVHQRASVEFALRKGRAALFLDTGLGKSGCEAVFADECRRETGKPSLILTPLAVARQMQRECEAFGIEARIIRDQSEAWPGVNIANYERLPKLDPDAYGAVVLDESSILKSFTGATKRALVEAFRKTPYRLAATATPAPNDHMEIGQHAEFLGVMLGSEMLARWFINDTKTASQEWRLKGHAKDDFWAWVASWARAASLPSDLGGDDTGFILPPLQTVPHVVDVDLTDGAEDTFFRLPDNSATSIHAEKARTLQERMLRTFEIVTGRFSTKLAETCEDESCRGSLNTPKTGETNLHLIRNTESGATHKETGKTQSAGPNTCVNTTLPTSQNGSVAQKRKRKSTQSAESATETTLNSERTASDPRAGETQTQSSTLASWEITGSAGKNSTQWSSVNQDAAPSAETSENSTSTIATKQERSEDFSAHAATRPSGSSWTMREGSLEPSNISDQASLDPWLIYCERDDEQDELERLFGDLCLSVRGSDPIEKKEQNIDDWLSGKRPVFISKPRIVGYGLNFQHCSNIVFASLSHSYEVFYQAVRRSWRFGQTRPVHAHIVLAETEIGIWRNVQRKAADHDRMKAAMTRAMAGAQRESKRRAYTRAAAVTLPSFLKG